jgi:hypothetical protein
MADISAAEPGAGNERLTEALDGAGAGWCNAGMEDLVAWIQGLFRDCSARAPFGIGWELDRGEAPLTATVKPAECSTARIKLRGDTQDRGSAS